MKKNFFRDTILNPLGGGLNFLCGGNVNEPFCSRIHRNKENSRFVKCVQKVVDGIFYIVEKNHCKRAYMGFLYISQKRKQKIITLRKSFHTILGSVLKNRTSFDIKQRNT